MSDLLVVCLGIVCIHVNFLRDDVTYYGVNRVAVNGNKVVLSTPWTPVVQQLPPEALLVR